MNNFPKEGEIWAVNQDRMVTFYVKAGHRTLDCNTTPFVILHMRVKPDWFRGFFQSGRWFKGKSAYGGAGTDSHGIDRPHNMVTWVLQEGQVGWIWTDVFIDVFCYRINLEPFDPCETKVGP